MAALTQLSLTRPSHSHGGLREHHGQEGAEHHGETSPCATCPTQRADLPDDAPVKVHRRFDRLARLVGDSGVGRLAAAHVVVVGVGGVGSFAAEALARSGVGRLTLVDFDLICITNTNRQLHAMKGTVGRAKVDVMAERLRLVHPTARIDAVRAFYSAQDRDLVLGEKPTFVIDAIDNVTAKLDLLVTCLKREIPVITAMGASGRIDPTRVRVDDLAFTVRDALAKDVRRWLVRKHGVTARDDGSFGIPAVYSDEERIDPAVVAADEAHGFECVCPHGDNDQHTCEKRARIDGTASFVTGAFGLAAAGFVVRAIAHPERASRTAVTPKNDGARRPRRARGGQ